MPPALYGLKFRAALVHFGVSATLAFVSALIVFSLWYRYPFGEISGGRFLFLLTILVDVMLGPVCMFVVFNPKKSRLERLADLVFIISFQIAALAYGLWTAYQARPVHIVFEYDRFRVVHAIEVPKDKIALDRSDIDPMPITGPTLLSLRALTADEQMAFTLAALGGVPVAAQPTLWRPYDDAKIKVLSMARSIQDLRKRFPERNSDINQVIEGIGSGESSLVYMPVVSRNEKFWTVLLDKSTARPMGWLSIDSF